MAAQPQGWPWQFFEISGSFLLALDPEGQVKYVNRKGAETLGRPPGEIIGYDWFENFIPVHLRDKGRAVFRQVSAGAANAPDLFENAVLRPDGSERIIAWRNALARDASGRVVAVLAAGEDVTEQRQSEAAPSRGFFAKFSKNLVLFRFRFSASIQFPPQATERGPDNELPPIRHHREATPSPPTTAERRAPIRP